MMDRVRIDAGMENIVEFESVGTRMIPAGMARELSLTKIVDKKYRFGSEAGVAAYLNLVRPKNAHGMYGTATTALEKKMHDIMRCISDSFRDAGCRARPPALLALGSRDAGREGIIVKSLLHEYESLKLSVFGHSGPLLFYGLRHLQKEFFGHIRDGRLEIGAVLGGSFEKPERGYKLLTAMMCMHDMAVEEFFETLGRLVDNKTLVFFDVEMLDGRTEKEMCDEYESDEMKRFAFSPLEMLHGLSKYGPEYEPFSECVYDPATVSTQAVTYDTLQGFANRYNLPIRARGMLLKWVRDKPRVIIPTYEPTRGAPYVLGDSARFEKVKFHGLLEKHGYMVMGRWQGEESHTAYYLVAQRGGFFK